MNAIEEFFYAQPMTSLGKGVCCVVVALYLLFIYGATRKPENY